MRCFHVNLYEENDTKNFSIKLAKIFKDNIKQINQGFVIYLYGDLGAGKSCLSRYFIQYFLPEQKVKSPTYNLVESYPIKYINSKSTQKNEFTVHHFDLYRLINEEELLYLGIKELLTNPYIAFIEWPQNGGSELPKPDLSIYLETHVFENKIGRKTVVKSHGKLDFGVLYSTITI